MRILGVNGIYNWSWSKNSFTDQFLLALDRQHEVVDIKYPLMLAGFAYSEFAIKHRAKKILAANKPGDVLIAHSFGCLVSIYAMRMGAKFSSIFFFGAACEPTVDLPMDAFRVLYNIHSPDDRALTVGSKLPHHEFGTMGKYGYTGNDPRVHNVRVLGYDHNDYVLTKNLCSWVSFIEHKLEEVSE